MELTNEPSTGSVTVWTVGHSRHPITTFLALIGGQGITVLVDVRSRPFSRFSPQFNQKALQATLATAGIAYRHVPALGGLHEGAGVGNEYREAIADLVERARNARVVIMCSEGDHTKCHRHHMIGASLTSLRHEVIHIQTSGSLLPA